MNIKTFGLPDNDADIVTFAKFLVDQMNDNWPTMTPDQQTLVVGMVANAGLDLMTAKIMAQPADSPFTVVGTTVIDLSDDEG